MRIPRRSVEELGAVRVENRDQVAVVLGTAVHLLIWSKRAILATKVQLAALRRNPAEKPSISRRNVR